MGFYWILVGLLILVVVVVLWEVSLWAYRTHRKGALYKEAEERARLTGRPLVVIGSPVGGATDRLIGARHGAGDYCVDIIPSEGARVANIQAPAHEYLREVDADSVVIYSSMVLEYVEDDVIEETIENIKRTVGSPENVFIINIQKYALTPYYYGGTKRIITRTPTKDEFTFEYESSGTVVKLTGNTEDLGQQYYIMQN